MSLLARIKRELACRRLAADRDRRRNSFEIEQYRRRRAAALKGRKAVAQ